MKEYSDKVIFDKISKYTEVEEKNVLEVGCGNGRISSLLATKCCSLTAIDPDKKAIEHAQRKNLDIDFRVGSGENLNFPGNYFDLIIFTLSLHHQNSTRALQEANRVLKRDGRIIVIEPVIEGEIEQVFAFVHNENNDKKDAQKSIENCGLSVVNSETFEAKWEFINKEDLINSVFQYYRMPFQPVTAQKIMDFIGEKISHRPIVLLDTMIIQSLKKAN